MTLIESEVIGDFLTAITQSEYENKEYDIKKHYCGYIAVPISHPWYGKEYSDFSCDAHGGLTYGHSSYMGHELEIKNLQDKINKSGYDWCQRLLDNEIEKQGLPVNYPIETELDLWWFGFDCDHYSDTLYPKEIGYVRGELEGMVSQAARAYNEFSDSSRT